MTRSPIIANWQEFFCVHAYIHVIKNDAPNPPAFMPVGCQFFSISCRMKRYSRPINSSTMMMTTTKPNTPLGP